MKLINRLWLLGAFVPSVGMIVLAVTSGWLLRSELETSLDHALLTQAATEAVSLFDGDGPPGEGSVHLHMSSSPLQREVSPFAPSAAIYRQDGSLLIKFPRDFQPEARLLPVDPQKPRLQTRRTPAGETFREVVCSLIDEDDHKTFTLLVSASLQAIDRTMALYWRTSLAGAFAFGLFLLGLQGWTAQGLARRLRVLGENVSAVREGDLERSFPTDRSGDEIADLQRLLEDTTSRLREARASQDRLMADAAHELRTPLTIMRTGIDVALRRAREPEELRQTLEQTRDEVIRLAALASRLLDLASRGQAVLDRQESDLTVVIWEAIDAALPAAEARNLSIVAKLPAQARARIHAPSIRQAVDNLLSNAFKYTPVGSEILVELDLEGDRWVLGVKDGGPGIPVEHRQAVFEPFHRVPGSLPGSGLGLAIVRDIARVHGGRASVRDDARGLRVVLEIAVA